MKWERELAEATKEAEESNEAGESDGKSAHAQQLRLHLNWLLLKKTHLEEVASQVGDPKEYINLKEELTIWDGDETKVAPLPIQVNKAKQLDQLCTEAGKLAALGSFVHETFIALYKHEKQSGEFVEPMVLPQQNEMVWQNESEKLSDTVAAASIVTFGTYQKQEDLKEVNIEDADSSIPQILLRNCPWMELPSNLNDMDLEGKITLVLMDPPYQSNVDKNIDEMVIRLGAWVRVGGLAMIFCTEKQVDGYRKAFHNKNLGRVWEQSSCGLITVTRQNGTPNCKNFTHF